MTKERKHWEETKEGMRMMQQQMGTLQKLVVESSKRGRVGWISRG